MHKRVVFRNRVLPYLLVAPQLVITLVFFIWPAGQALFQSVLLQDAFGLSTKLVWFENFQRLFADPNYVHAFGVTVVFSVATTALALGLALLLAVMADRVIAGAMGYKTILIAPYAVAPAVAGVLWLFMFHPTVGIFTYLFRAVGYDWNFYLRGGQALLLVILAAAWKQISYNFLFFLAGPAKATETLVYKVFNDGFIGLDFGGSAAQSVILMAMVMGLTVVQFRYIERRVQY